MTLTQGFEIFPGSSLPIFLPTQAACVQQWIQESGPILAGLGSRGSRGEAGSPTAPGASIHKPHSGLLQVPWAAQWLTHSPMYSKELPSQGAPARFSTLLSSHTLMSLLTSGSTSSRAESLSSLASLVNSECQGFLSRSVGMGDAKKRKGPSHEPKTCILHPPLNMRRFTHLLSKALFPLPPPPSILLGKRWELLESRRPNSLCPDLVPQLGWSLFLAGTEMVCPIGTGLN